MQIPHNGSTHWFSNHVRIIQQHWILFQSLPISFRPGEHCRSPSAHLPVSGFIPPKERDREGEVGEEMSERARKQVMDNSVFGGYRREGLADLSQAKVNRGGLEAEGLPKRDTVVGMIEWGTMPTPSLCSHLSMKTQDPLPIQPLPKRDVDFLYPSQFYMSPFLSIFLSPPGMGLSLRCPEC